MKKAFIITAALAGAIILSSAALQDDNQKEYVSIYVSAYDKSVSISNSKGELKTEPYEKRKSTGDQTQILKLIAQYEAQGYKVKAFNTMMLGGMSELTSVCALLEK